MAITAEDILSHANRWYGMIKQGAATSAMQAASFVCPKKAAITLLDGSFLAPSDQQVVHAQFSEEQFFMVDL
jgi:hypothetical protein